MPKAFTTQQNKLIDLPVVLSERVWVLVIEPEPSIEGFSRLRMIIDEAYHELLRCPTAKQWNLWIVSHEPCIDCEYVQEIGLVLQVETHVGEPSLLRILLPEEV